MRSYNGKDSMEEYETFDGPIIDDPQNHETSAFCKIHKIEYFYSCPRCNPGGRGEYADELIRNIYDQAGGLRSQTWYDLAEIEAETAAAVGEMEHE